MIKEYEPIRFLLNKYWNCETSLEEEKKLRDFFSGEDIPEDLQPYAPHFRYCKESRNSIRLGNDFDKKLETAIRQKEKEKQYITIRIFAPALKIAASIAIIITLGVGIYFLVNENRKPYFAETYNDPDAAFKDATYALEKLSEALRKGEEVSIKTLDELKGWNIDWTTLDSADSVDSTDVMDSVDVEATGNGHLPQSHPRES